MIRKSVKRLSEKIMPDNKTVRKMQIPAGLSRQGSAERMTDGG